jgi:hypothetical protein
MAGRMLFSLSFAPLLFVVLLVACATTPTHSVREPASVPPPPGGRASKGIMTDQKSMDEAKAVAEI